VIDFQVIHLNESEHMAPNLVQVGYGGDAPSPDFVGGFPIQGGR
jgi:hypothetical protein